MTNDGLPVLLEVTAVLERLEVPYFVAGSMASSFHGSPRLTQDADLVADLAQEQVAEFVSALASRFYVDESKVTDAVRRRRSFNVIHLQSSWKVDVFVRPQTGHHAAEMQRRVRVDTGGGAQIWMATPEDTVLQKLRWFAVGGQASDRQLDDVREILRIRRGELDDAYLDEWARALGVADQLDRLRNEA